ncbi:MAG TPA: hypothetical protein VMU65_10385 [Candidatus Saccharimonadales bacterium]|nr:hypothetical protein [Candidatus Saccharimonadales bacterium]
MTESIASPQWSTEQPAGTYAGRAAPPAASPDVTIQGQSSRPPYGTSGEGAPLLANNADFMARWTAIQTTFVDEPRMAVEQADTLVAEVVRELARVFAAERGRLEGAWSRGTDVSTEDLRQALQRYRDFFHLLLRG